MPIYIQRKKKSSGFHIYWPLTFKISLVSNAACATEDFDSFQALLSKL